nr:Peroxisome biogenesis protein 1 [Ipomoea batatas]
MEFDVRVAAGIESCFVSLPITLINTLASTVSSTYLALQLRSSHNNLWHVAWSGSASSPPSASSIQIAQQYMRSVLGYLTGRLLKFELFPICPKASMVTIEPDTEYDWEVMELNSELAEQAILKQIYHYELYLKVAHWEACLDALEDAQYHLIQEEAQPEIEEHEQQLGCVGALRSTTAFCCGVFTQDLWWIMPFSLKNSSMLNSRPLSLRIDLNG